MSIELRRRVERLERFVEDRKLAMEERAESVRWFAKMYDVQESQVGGVWDRVVGDAGLNSDSMCALMEELNHEGNLPPDPESLERRLAEIRD